MPDRILTLTDDEHALLLQLVRILDDGSDLGFADRQRLGRVRQKLAAPPDPRVKPEDDGVATGGSARAAGEAGVANGGKDDAASDTSVLQEDLRALCRLLGMPDGARPISPHAVFQECLGALRLRLPCAAAAPELYFALHAVTDACDDGAPPEVIVRARQALAKARDAVFSAAPGKSP